LLFLAAGKPGPSAVWASESSQGTAQLLQAQVQLPTAEQMYIQHWLSEKAPRLDNALSFGRVNNLGGLCNGQGRLAEAEQTYERTLTEKEKALRSREHMTPASNAVL